MIKIKMCNFEFIVQPRCALGMVATRPTAVAFSAPVRGAGVLDLWAMFLRGVWC